MKTKQTLAAIALTTLSLSAYADLARVGPVDAPSPTGNGFPKWYQDLNGTVLDLCLPDANDPGATQLNACQLVGPGLPTPPYSFPDNFPNEAFYFNATSLLDMPGGKRVTLVLALEAAFSTGPVVTGDQITFTRIRVIAGVPEPGIYTVTHPYGVETFPVVNVSDAGNRDIAFTEDVGVARGVFDGALKSRVGPFLQRSASSGGAPLAPVAINGAQFLSDGVNTEFVTGSPFGTDYLEVCGVRADGSTIVLGDQGVNASCARSDQFKLAGRLHDFVANPIPSPLDVYNAFYRRDAAGTQVDVYARNIKALPSQPDPLLTAAAANIQPVMMTPFGSSALGLYHTQGMVDPSGHLPGPVSVINSADAPPSVFTKHVVDAVSALSASYDYANKTLTVVATSSDKGFGIDQLPPRLSLDSFSDTAVSTYNPSDPAEVVLTATGINTPPDTVTVKSSAGGSGTFLVSRNLATGGSAPKAGVPLALDDQADATASGPAIDIPVTANDVANQAALITSLQLVGLAIPAGSGSATINGTSISYAPGTTNGDVTFQYTASNSVGQSNAATVTVAVAPSTAGPAPIANPDGPVSVVVNQSVAIDVLANDSGNGGTLNPGSIIVSNVTGGTTTPDGTGKVSFAAGATAGNFGFDYTVANSNGQVSPSTHAAVAVVNPENIQISRSTCRPISTTSGEWRVTGTSSVLINNSIQLYKTASVPADLNTNKLGAAVPVAATGAWEYRAKPGPACVTPISLRSSATGATRSNIAVSR